MAEAALQEAVQAMNSGKNVFDVTIICTTDDHQADYWMERLSQSLLPTSDDSDYPMVLAVSEDWEGSGAGNGLGTLYAFQKANELALKRFQVNLETELAQGKLSAALYHTAGKGTRLAPLPASENNNKPGVKLPFGFIAGDHYESLTVLESVIKQTGIYASSRKGRLSVFWGDQVFLPSAPFVYTPTHHVDILCTLLGDTAPTADEWKTQGLEKYGVIACIERDGRIDAAQVEKVTHETATKMLSTLGTIRQVGPSLGSFSISASFLQGLIKEFAVELSEKTAKLDTDPHFWMPLTLSIESYISLMEQKGTDEATAKAHYERMSNMMNGFDMGSMGLFGAVNVGKDACWWDYGQLKLYSKNTLLLLENSDGANLLKQFLNVNAHNVASRLDGVTVDGISYVFGSNVKSGSVKKSLLAHVSALDITVEGAIVVNCAARKITAGPGCILYNLIQDEIIAEAGQVMVGVTDETGETMLLQSHMDIDGGKVWKEKLEMNDMSFEEVHKKNQDANIREIQKIRQEKFDTMVASMGLQ